MLAEGRLEALANIHSNFDRVMHNRSIYMMENYPVYLVWATQSKIHWVKMLVVTVIQKSWLSTCHFLYIYLPVFISGVYFVLWSIVKNGWWFTEMGTIVLCWNKEHRLFRSQIITSYLWVLASGTETSRELRSHLAIWKE